MMPRLSPRWIKIILIAAIGVVGVLYFAYSRVSLNADLRNFDSPSQVPPHRWGMVLGTSRITPAGKPNPSYENRMTAAALLYQSGRVKRLIVSGGDYRANEKFGCDEPADMVRSLTALGVPRDSIEMDYQGQRTLKSVLNAKNRWHLDSVIFISQQGHNERAIYLADHLGLKSVGFNAAPTPYGWVRLKLALREVGARVKMFLDLSRENPQ